MKQKLPSYIVESLIVSGFDDVVSIMGMNLDDGPKNSIQEIEKYIDERKVNYPQCIRPNEPLNTPFEFPPGHKIRIEKFVQEIKMKHGVAKNPQGIKSISKGHTRKRKLEAIEGDSDNISSVTNDLRKKVIKWSREKCEKPLVESEDFTVLVQRDTLNPQQLTVSIRCLKCGNPQKINRKPTGSNPWQLSNFTKHYNSCTKSGKRKIDKQESLQKFFPVVPQTSETKTKWQPSSTVSAPVPSASGASQGQAIYPYFFSPFQTPHFYAPASTSQLSFQSPFMTYERAPLTPTQHEIGQLPSVSEYGPIMPTGNTPFAMMPSGIQSDHHNKESDSPESWDSNIPTGAKHDSQLHTCISPDSDNNASQNINTQSSQLQVSNQGFH